MNTTIKTSFNYHEALRKATEHYYLTHTIPEELIVEAIGEPPFHPTMDGPDFLEELSHYKELLTSYTSKKQKFEGEVVFMANGYTPKELAKTSICE